MQRLSAQDAGFLYAEVPTAPMHVSFLSVFDRPADGAPFDMVRRQVQARLPLLPLLRRRVVPVPFALHHPVLVDDPFFDLDTHVRCRAVRAPGGRAELTAVAAELVSRPLDRARPLWELHVLEGLEGGRFALLTKLHHAVIDGVSGIELMSTLLTPEPEPDAPASAVGQADGWQPEALPSDARLSAEAAVDLVRHPLRLSATIARESRGRLGRVVRLSPDVAPSPRIAPWTRLNGALTARRSVAVQPLSLASVRSVKNAFATSVNDVVLALVGGAVRSYLLARDALPASPLVAMVPVSTRRTGQSPAFGNQVSAIFVPLGTDLADPVVRLQTMRSATSAAKELHEAVAAPELMDWSVAAGPAVMSLAARLYSASRLVDVTRPPFNLVVSNVPGPREPLYCGTARMRSLHPFGPLGEGLGLNISLISYEDCLDFGLIACPDVVPDVEDIAGALQRELEALAAAAA
jgi:diacylglycerol O-acyltransferase